MNKPQPTLFVEWRCSFMKIFLIQSRPEREITPPLQRILTTTPKQLSQRLAIRMPVAALRPLFYMARRLPSGTTQRVSLQVLSRLVILMSRWNQRRTGRKVTSTTCAWKLSTEILSIPSTFIPGSGISATEFRSNRENPSTSLTKRPTSAACIASQQSKLNGVEARYVSWADFFSRNTRQTALPASSNQE